jgi:MFS family permease
MRDEAIVATRDGVEDASPRALRSSVGRLALARTVSLTGTYAASIALAFSIYQQTRSTAWVSATMILTFGVVGFFSPVAGAISDRFDRRRVMVAGELGAAAAWALMAGVTEMPAPLLGLAFCASLLESLSVPASAAAIPNLAGEAELARANSLIAIGRNAGLTIGPLVGGLLFAVVGARGVFGLNAASFAAAAGLVASVRGRFAEPDRDTPGTAPRVGLAAGIRFIAHEPVLRQMLLSWVVFVMGTASTIVAEPLLAGEFRAGSLGYGLLTACWGGGTILGAWLSRGVRREREAVWIVSFSGVMALTSFGIAASPWFSLILVWIAAFGLADGPTQVVEQNLLQRRTPDAVRGRVIGAWEAVMTGAFVAALLLGGIVVGRVGPSGAFVFAGILALAGSALLLPLLWWLRDDSSPEVGRAPETPVGTTSANVQVADQGLGRRPP